MRPMKEPISRREFLETTAAHASSALAGAAIASASLTGVSATCAAQRPPTQQPAKSEIYGPSKSPKPVLGIAEWYCYYVNFDTPPPESDLVEQCVDAHQAVGINHLVWSVGRAVVDYHSSNPRNTLLGELGSSVGGDDWSAVIRPLRKECLVRRAIKVSGERGMKFWGRLGMNRHYGGAKSIGVTSRFSQNNPRFRERRRDGKVDASRLCYAFDEVQTERLDILEEVQQMGVDGLVLDYCRQPPIARYHPRWIELFQQSGGQDPRSWKTPTLDQLTPWFQFRADCLTRFMRDLRKRVRAGELKSGRACPVIARVPCTSLVSNLAAGLDVAAWLREDLVDGLMLSPLVFCASEREPRFADYTKLAHQHGKTCVGGLGSLELIRNHVPRNTGFFHPAPMYRLLARQYEGGVDAMSVYQSESLARMDYLREHLRRVGDPAAVRVRAVSGEPKDISPWLGYDWHTSRKGRFAGYDLAGAGANAL